MPRKQKPTRVERGLYRSGKTYYACATPPGGQATSDAQKKQIAEQIQLRAMETATHVPLGQYFNPAALRKNISGLVPGGAQVYWNIKKN